MNKQEIKRADSIFEVREENRVLKQRLKGFEQIVKSLSIEVDRRGNIIGMLQKADHKKPTDFQTRKAA